MKRCLSLIIAAALLLALVACGAAEQTVLSDQLSDAPKGNVPEKPETPEPTVVEKLPEAEDPAGDQSVLTTEKEPESAIPVTLDSASEPVAPVQFEEPTAPAASKPASELLDGQANEQKNQITVEDALAYVDQDVSALYAAIGQPSSSHYEYSCSGPGDDGILYYDGFLVFTYVEDGVETVVDAEAE